MQVYVPKNLALKPNSPVVQRYLYRYSVIVEKRANDVCCDLQEGANLPDSTVDHVFGESSLILGLLYDIQFNDNNKTEGKQ